MSGDRLTVSGVDRIAASVTVGLALGLGVALAFPIAKLFGVLPALVVGAAIVLVAIGSRYRLTLDSDGFELVSYNAWIVPTQRQRFLLDWTVGLYQSFEADAPEGLCLTPPRGFHEAETDCFGPTDLGALNALVERFSIEQRRLQDKLTAVHELDLPLHPGLIEALAAEGRTFHPSGRLASAPIERPLELGGVRFEAGSVAHFNEEIWLDPRRPDRLTWIDAAAPTPLPIAGAPLLRAGGKIWFDADGRAYSASAVIPFGWSGLVIGDGHLGWSPDDGEVLSFSLDEPLVLGRWVLARASTFTRWATPLDRPDWYVHLEAPLEHPELGPFRAAVVRRDFGELRAISIDHDVRANGRTISGGRLPIPLRADGSVDVDACRRLGLVAPVDQAAQA